MADEAEGTPPGCEVCGRAVGEWRVGPTCVLWRCPWCGHVMRDLERCRARARVHAWGGDEALDSVRTWLTMRSLSRLLPGPAPLSVLEIGFGRGLLLARFAEAGHDVTGIDPGMLERDVPEELRRRAALHALPAEEMELSPDRFDLIYGIHVVEHLRDPAVVFRSCRAALRPGGGLYLITPNAGSEGLKVFGESWWNLEDPTHIRFYSRQSISSALYDAGFDRVLTRIPAWDSLTLEIGSVLRAVGWRSTEHGVLGSRLALAVYAMALPAAVVARLVRPALAPSMEVLATRSAQEALST
jgi:2-polyprenyl-3-methyl-5-hydroxy-6-metoxy-1,4-benzoquinol methylase